MTRTQELRGDARRVVRPCRAPASAAPLPVRVPLLVAATLFAAAATVLILVDLSTLEQVAIYLAAGLAALAVLHRALVALLAGVALAVIRPYAGGERLRLYSPAHGGDVEAVIVRLGPVNATLATDTGPLFVPNYRLLRGGAEPQKSVHA